MLTHLIRLLLLMILLTTQHSVFASGMTLMEVTNESTGEVSSYSMSLQVLLILTLLSFLPAILMSMTSFIRIVVVLAILRQAIGLQQTPSNQIMIGLALFMTAFIMQPVFEQVHRAAIQPYLSEEMTFQQAISEAKTPIKDFMYAQTRHSDLLAVGSLQDKTYTSVEDVGFFELVPAFIMSELKTAFQIGFLIFLPFLVIDLVVASILMAMGMMMLSPLIVSLPFKIMLFVLIDGWVMMMGTLTNSFL